MSERGDGLRVDDQPAFILHRRDYGNASLILELLTDDFGRVGVLAKGARKRRDVGSFQPGSRLAVGWRGHGELKTLSAIESRRIDIPADRYLPLLYVNELLLALTRRFDPLPGLFPRYQYLLLSLASADLEPALRDFEMSLLSALGLMPAFERCVEGNPLEPEAHYRLLPQSGLQASAEGDPSAERGAVWLAIAGRQFDDAAVCRAAGRALRQIIDSNLAGRELQSRKLYLQMTRNPR
jgi:DNA repair protein RecO (recombination protein O)